MRPFRRSPLAARARLLAPLVALLLLLTQAALPLKGLLPPAAATLSGPPAPQSSDELAWRAPFNRPEFFPLDRRPDPGHYLPHAAWMGRLILPEPAELAARPGDWVWIEIQQTPEERGDLIGRRLRLSWQDLPSLKSLVATVRTDIRLGEAARRSAADGNVVPTRLHGRHAVGPLQSLAGARAHDDVVVRLEEVQLEAGEVAATLAAEPGELRIALPPVQTTGRWMALARILGPDPSFPGDPDRFRVRHYERTSHDFVGPIESVRIPRQPPDRFGRRLFDTRGLAATAAGEEGWTLYGAPAADGVFTVQALEPRRLTRLVADRRIDGTRSGLHHIVHGNWRDTPRQRGRISRVALWPDHGRPSLLGRRDVPGREWAIGDRALIVHGFGGIGGPDGEPVVGFTVTGHFAFGQAEVVADPFTGEPRFERHYHQIYANNPNGIVAGTQDWSAYGGNLQRGWLGTRPLSDVLVKGEGPLLRELALQTEVMMARYRSGDGGGVALVTAATSCVQDSSQALWIAIDRLRRGLHGHGGSTPGIEDRFREERLVALTRSLDALLTPFGMVRSDWRSNAERIEAGLPGAGGGTPVPGEGFRSGQTVRDVLLSWRSMLPRRAHDDLAATFLRQGAPLWILRTNQIPGADPRLEPLAPTLLLGQIPLLSTLLRRLSDALFAPFGAQGLALTLALLGGYAAITLPLGLRSGFLHRGRLKGPPSALICRAATLLAMPALGEELLFRVALLPHPLEGGSTLSMLGWGALSVGLFVLYHPLATRLWYLPGRRLFDDPRFLLPCALLGIACVFAYSGTGSLVAPTLLHWIVVVAWIESLGGGEVLRRSEPLPGRNGAAAGDPARPTAPQG